MESETPREKQKERETEEDVKKGGVGRVGVEEGDVGGESVYYK